jgi:predicted outer membrane repeat protein
VVDGGAMLIGSEQCAITNTTYRDNTAKGSGGAIRVDAGNFTISDSLVTTNSAFGGNFGLGGAILISPGCNSTFDNTIFRHNSATEGSGGAVSTNGDSQINDCNFDNNSAASGGALRYGPTGTVTVENTIFSNNEATFTAGAIHSDFKAQAATLSDTVLFSNNTAFCCYAKSSGSHTTTITSTCVDIAYQETAISECCAANAYSDGINCRLCTAELTCAGIVGANTSTVVLPKGVWRASTTSFTTYSCWNADACVGGVARTSTDDYCAAGYKGPCK